MVKGTFWQAKHHHHKQMTRTRTSGEKLPPRITQRTALDISSKAAARLRLFLGVTSAAAALLLLLHANYAISAAATTTATSVPPPATYGPPIPPQWLAGHLLAASSTPAPSLPVILIEAFFDHLCPDSKAAWPALREAGAKYADRGVQIIVHVSPLPYHRNAFYAAQGGLVTAKNSKDKDHAFFSYLDAVFAVQDQFFNNPTHNMTGAQIVDRFAEVAAACCAVSPDAFIAGMQYGSQFDAEARIRWKQGAARGVFGTPQFFVNGAYVNNGAWTVDQWESLLESLLPNKDGRSSLTI